MAIVDRKLGKNSTRTEADTVELDIMLENCVHTFELFNALVDSLMTTSNAASCVQQLIILVVYHAGSSFDFLWVFSYIAIIRFDPLTVIQHVLQSKVKDHNIGPIAAWKWSHAPHNVSCKNAESYFVPNPRPVELVGLPGLGAFVPPVDPAVGAVNGTSQTIIIFVALFTIVPDDL